MSAKDPSDPHATTVVLDGEGQGEGLGPSVPADDRYVVEEEVGRGGLGRVLRAVDKKLGRAIVLKQLLHRSPDLEERFEREARLSSRLEHPSIVTVHDLVLDADQPFYTMRLVSGRTLGALIHERASVAERLALLPNVIAVADAVAYAHSRGILHRDIKPANILVGSFGETVLIDWGLAKDLEHPEPVLAPVPGSSETGLTRVGDVIGTPAYMPPEQAAGDSVDERADIYAIGAVLYEVLTGHAPHAFPAGTSDLARLHEQPPPRVLLEAEGTPADLGAIVEKAMARDRKDRYARAAELAADLKRFTTGQIVSVYRYSTAALFRRWIRRYRLPVAIAGVALAAIAVVSVLSVRRVVSERDRAEARANDLRVAQARAVVASDPTQALAWLASAYYDEARFRAAHPIAVEASRLGVARDVLVVDREPTTAFAALPDRRHVVVGSTRQVIVWDLASRRPIVVAVDDGPVVAVSGEGERIAVATQAGRVFVIDLAGREVGAATRHRGVPNGLAWSPDGRRLAVITHDVEVRDLAGAVERVAHDDAGVASVAWSADGSQLAWGGAAGTFALRRGSSPPEVFGDGTGGPIWTLFFGQRLHVVRTDGVLGVLEAQPVWRSDASPGQIVVVTPLGDELVSGGVNGVVTRWRVAPERLDASTSDVSALAVSADGAWIGVGAMSGEVRVVASDAERGFPAIRLLGHRGRIVGLAFVADGLLASAARDGELRLWSLDDPGRDRGFAVDGPVRELAFLGGNELACVTRAGQVSAFRLDGSARRAVGTVGHEAMMAVSADARWIAAAGEATLRVWPAAGGAARELAGHTQAIRGLGFSPDGAWLASAGGDNRAFLWSLGDGARRELPHDGVALDAAFSADSRLVAVAGLGAETRVWSTDGTLVRALRGHEIGVRRVAWSSKGLLATAGLDGVARVWEPARDDRVRGELARAHGLFKVAFSGNALAAGGDEGELVIWTPETGRVLPLPGHTRPIYDLAYSPDGKHLASTGPDGTVRLWDPGTGLARIFVSPNGLWRLAFSADGRWLAAGDERGLIHLWRVGEDALPQTPGALLGWIRGQTTAEIDDGGHPRTVIAK